MRKKKIVILALLGDPTLPAGMPYTGGFNQTLRELLTSLAASSIPICVITDKSQYNTDDYVRISNNIDLYRVSISENEHKIQENLRVAVNRILHDIINILGNTIFDVALIHSFYWISGHLARCLNDIYRIPYIHTPISLAYHKIATGSEANCQFQVDCEQAFLQNANHVLAITEQESKILSKYYQLSPKQIIITGRSVDKVFHSPARDNKGNPRNIAPVDFYADKNQDTSWWSAGAYTYLGRMVAIKGIIQIIYAWVSLQKRYGTITPPLWLVGGTPAQISNLREEIIKQVGDITEYEKQHSIVWWGYLDQASISAVFLKTLVLVTHSKFEAGGRVILEAMCQGKPVIATPNGFAADYIQDRFNGFLVPYGDMDRLEKCMGYFIRQPYLSYSMGNAAKLTFEQIERGWSYTEVHKKLYEYYLAGQTTQLSISSPIIPILTHETIEKIDCFPYFDTNFSKKDWYKELSPIFSEPLEKFNQIHLKDAHARHYSFKCGDSSYRVKQFYNRLNMNAIWNKEEKEKVIENTDQFLMAQTSQFFDGVVSIPFHSKHGNYYVLPELEYATPDYQKLFLLLNAFSMSKPLENSILSECSELVSIQMQMQENVCHSLPKTLELAIKSLATSSSELELGISRQVLAYLPQIENLLVHSLSYVRFGFNYGKAVTPHVVTQNEQLMLLPTADWYWGELGVDYVSTALQEGKEVHRLPWQTDDTRQLLWQIYLSWRNILEAEWNGIDPSTFWTHALSQALLKLNLTDEFIKF